MKTILFTIVLLLSATCYSQQNIDEELQYYISNYKNFDFEELKNKKFNYSIDSLDFLPKYLKNTFSERVSRDIDFGVRETIYSAILNHAGDDGIIIKTSNTLHVLSKNAAIIGIICRNEYTGTNTIYCDELEIQNYITKHDSLYQTNTTVSDLINDLVNGTVYGYSCGNAPVIRDVPERGGLKFNDINNIDIFRKWIRSYNPEIQTYGVDAIAYIYKQPSFSISQKQKDMEQQDKRLAIHIGQRNSTINTCSGCIVGIYEKVF